MLNNTVAITAKNRFGISLSFAFDHLVKLSSGSGWLVSALSQNNAKTYIFIDWQQARINLHAQIESNIYFGLPNVRFGSTRDLQVMKSSQIT